jgi:glycosyltransferase involved in cell wall biosynthesis
VVCAYNEERYLGACLKHLLKQPPDNLHEIIVVDNASVDKTAEIARSFDKVRVVYEPQKGLTRARQRGFLEAQTELIAYVDADTHIVPGWYDILNDAFSRDPELVCLSGPYDYNYDLNAWQRFWVRLYMWLVSLLPRAKKPVVFGGNFVVKKQALEKIGGFDIEIEFYGEDTNLARRLASIGKVKFDQRFYLRTSARRLKNEGMFLTGLRYVVNYFWELIFQRPFSRTHRDFR